MRKSSENALVLKLFSCLEISKVKPYVLVVPVVIYTTQVVIKIGWKFQRFS